MVVFAARISAIGCEGAKEPTNARGKMLVMSQAVNKERKNKTT